jgi:hypothetical protein
MRRLFDQKAQEEKPKKAPEKVVQKPKKGRIPWERSIYADSNSLKLQLLSTCYCQGFHLKSTMTETSSKLANWFNSNQDSPFKPYGGITKDAIQSKIPEFLQDAIAVAGVHDIFNIQENEVDNRDEDYVYYLQLILQKSRERKMRKRINQNLCPTIWRQWRTLFCLLQIFIEQSSINLKKKRKRQQESIDDEDDESSSGESYTEIHKYDDDEQSDAEEEEEEEAEAHETTRNQGKKKCENKRSSSSSELKHYKTTTSSTTTRNNSWLPTDQFKKKKALKLANDKDKLADDFIEMIVKKKGANDVTIKNSNEQEDSLQTKFKEKFPDLLTIKDLFERAKLSEAGKQKFYEKSAFVADDEVELLLLTLSTNEKLDAAFLRSYSQEYDIPTADAAKIINLAKI